MFRNVCAAVLIACAASPAFADTQAESFFDHRAWDVGTVPRNTTFYHSFQVKNTTNKPMHIASIRVSCGCVSASAVKQNLAPGEATTVMAQIESRQFTGMISKTIFVLLDQPVFEEVRIHVQANVVPELVVSPTAFTFGKLKKGSATEHTIVVSFPAGRQSPLEKVTSESGFVNVKMEPLAEGANSRAYRVTAKLSPDLPVGNWECTVWLSGTDRNMPPINLPLRVEILPETTAAQASRTP